MKKKKPYIQVAKDCATPIACASCVAGKYSPSGEPCAVCNEGFQPVVPANSSWNKEEQGKQAGGKDNTEAAGASSCEPCPRGHASILKLANGGRLCGLCGLPLVPDEERKSCVPCRADQKADPVNYKCVDCPMHQVCPKGSDCRGPIPVPPPTVHTLARNSRAVLH